MNLKSHLPILVLGAMTITVLTSFGHTSAPQSLTTAPASLPAFEVATIKPVNPNRGGPIGFYSRPGGRVLVGHATLKMVLYYAFDVQEFQISGGPDWIGKDRYDVEALPPDSSPSRTAKQPPVQATPNAEQRKMLQRLLEDRCGLKVHKEMKEGPVYILSRGKNKLQLQEPKDKDADSRGGVVMRGGGIVDGEAFGTNLSMAFLANQLSNPLGSPVLDQTGLTGSYDFHLEPSDPENRDMIAAIFEAMRRLGLELRRGRGPVDTLVIDHIERPSEN